MKSIGFFLFSLAGLLSLATAAGGSEVGTVAAVEGSAEIGRAATWSDAEVGNPVQQGDRLRTGRAGRLRVIFQDDSVLNLGEDSEVTVDQQIFDPGTGEAESLMKLLKGRVRALVSDYYQQTGSVYQIETPTAVSGVRGTEFIVSYDEEEGLTEVIGISGRVEVHSILDRAANGVFVTSGEIAKVAQGAYPTKPPRLEENLFRQYLEGMQFVGIKGTQSLASSHPIIGGADVPEPDRAPPPVVENPSAADREDPTAAGLVDQPLRQSGRGDLGVRF